MRFEGTGAARSHAGDDEAEQDAEEQSLPQTAPPGGEERGGLGRLQLAEHLGEHALHRGGQAAAAVDLVGDRGDRALDVAVVAHHQVQHHGLHHAHDGSGDGRDGHHVAVGVREGVALLGRAERPALAGRTVQQVVVEHGHGDELHDQQHVERGVARELDHVFDDGREAQQAAQHHALAQGFVPEIVVHGFLIFDIRSVIAIRRAPGARSRARPR